MSRLDLAKMMVESLTKSLGKRLSDHASVVNSHKSLGQLWHAMGLGYVGADHFMLLTTTRQYGPSTALCGAGGRLLVSTNTTPTTEDEVSIESGSSNQASFDRQLKCLKVVEEEGGAVGLNAALSTGLALLMRHRLTRNRATENFGMGRLPSNSLGGHHTLQPATLILLTDGEALRAKGASLELSFGGRQPLKEFYLEPFRWDQRIFCIGVGDHRVNTTELLHPSLRALCEVTGGKHLHLQSPSSLSSMSDTMIRSLAPPRPKEVPIPDPLLRQYNTSDTKVPRGAFVNGGPICCFQQLEAIQGKQSPTTRAMIHYVPRTANNKALQQPTWCIPDPNDGYAGALQN
ncbi:MAG: hypothetical protein AAGJ35_15190, partial [Myxococcota bacterium]